MSRARHRLSERSQYVASSGAPPGAQPCGEGSDTGTREGVGIETTRQALGLTQVEPARRREVTPCNVAQIEKRGELLVSTLASLPSARGQIVVQFPAVTRFEIEFAAAAGANGECELDPRRDDVRAPLHRDF